jgi:hypothetical protein
MMKGCHRSDPAEDSAVAILSQIYSGSSNQLLGEARFFAGVPGVASDFSPFNFNGNSEAISVNEDELRFKTTALVVGDVQISSFFNEFEVNAVPETSGGVVAFLIGSVVVCRRKRSPLTK